VATKKKTLALVDPTLPFTEIEIEGKTYKMCFDLAALALAEDRLIAAGHDANLLMAMVQLSFSRTRILFAVSLQVYQPELDYEVSKTWVNDKNLTAIVLAISEAWRINAPDPEKAPADPL
jgi:hypothetical protein